MKELDTKDFKVFIIHKQDMFDDGNPLDLNLFMTSCVTRYMALINNNQWKSGRKRGTNKSEIVALNSLIVDLNAMLLAKPSKNWGVTLIK